MSLEARVTSLEDKFETLDNAVRNLIKITSETHQVVLENQRENRIRFDQQDREIAVLKEIVLAHERRFDQLELLIRQLLPNTDS